MKNILKKGKVEGSILFTVIAVMMVMVVFLMSTLVLTSSANRRSYYTYYETQAQYAAQAALDAVTNSAYTDGDFYNWVVQASKDYADDPGANPKPMVKVDFGIDSDKHSNIPFNNRNKYVECVVEKADDTLVWDELTGAVHKTPAYKITATAKVGSGKNTSEYTVVNYIYENYRIKDPTKLPSVENEAVNTLYRYRQNSNPNDNPLIPGVPKAVYSFGKNSAGENVQYFGPQYNNMGEIPAGRILYDSLGWDSYIKLQNDNNSVGNAVYVGNLTNSVHSTYVFQDYGEHAIVYGNLVSRQVTDKGFFFMGNISGETKNQRGAVAYSQSPYVYIDGIIDESGEKIDNNEKAGAVFIGFDDEFNEGNTNVNLYCGGINIQGKSTLIVRGDVFMYDPGVNSVWGGTLGKDGITTRLGYFVDNNVGKLNTKWGISNAGGNIFCNNDSLDIDVDMTIPGDLVFTNKQGTLNINANVEVWGKVICAGKLNGAGNLTCDTIVTSSSAKVDGIEYTMESVTDPNLAKFKIDTNEDGTPDAFDYSGFMYDKYADKDFYGIYINTNDETYYENTNSDEVIANWEEYKADAYQQALMPYNMRLDEIFGTYYRWDLKADSNAKAQENMDGDKMVAESVHTGHIYGIKEFDCGGYVSEVVGTTTKTAMVFDNEAQNLDQSKYKVIRELNDWNEIQAVPGGEGHWKLIEYEYEENIYGEPKWVSNIVYVPYTTSRSASNFVPTYSPITNDREIATALGDTMITDIGAFAMPSSAPKYTCGNRSGYTKITSTSAGLIRANVPIGYHETGPANNFDKTRTLDDAFVIKESCYIDLADAVTYGTTHFFIDPTGHDASDPIKIVLSGAGQVAGLFVVNNTANYSTDYKTITKSYAEQGTIAAKGSVQIFLEEGFYANNLLYIFNSGLFPLAYDSTSDYSTGSGTFRIVSNPLYPKEKDGSENKTWKDLNHEIKYAYEYVPITMVYGKAGATYGGQNGWVMNANVSIPKSTYDCDNSTCYKANVTYQEYWYSEPYNKAAYPCFGIGTIVCGDMQITGGEAASVVYIGDDENPGGDVIDSHSDTTRGSGKLGRDNTEYFSNDHLGAS